MGDHRATIKMSMKFHGIEREHEMWINYNDSDGNGVDQRIIDFFGDVYREGRAKFDCEQMEFEREQNAAKIEAAERRELQRLKEKYQGKDAEP